jgi:hypothetical protein
MSRINHGLFSPASLYNFWDVSLSGDDGEEKNDQNSDCVDDDDDDDSSFSDDDASGARDYESYNTEKCGALELELYSAIQNNDTPTAMRLLSDHEGGLSTLMIDPKHRLQWSMLHWASYHGNERLVAGLLNCNAASKYKTYQLKKQFFQSTGNDLHNSKPSNNAKHNHNHAVPACVHVVGDANHRQQPPLGDTIHHTVSSLHSTMRPSERPRPPGRPCINGQLAERQGRALREKNGGTAAGGAMKQIIDPVCINTPLHRAAMRGHLPVVRLLMLSSYDIQDVDNLGNTPLHLSAAAGRVETLACLIHAGADLYVRNRYNNTPMDVAKDDTCRHLLQQAMTQYYTSSSALAVSRQAEVRLQMFRASVKEFLKADQAIHMALDGDYSEDAEVLNVAQLEQDLKKAAQLGIPTETIQLGYDRIQWESVRLDLIHAMKGVQTLAPTTTLTALASVQALKEAKVQGERMASGHDDEHRLAGQQLKLDHGKTFMQRLNENALDLTPLLLQAEDLCEVSESEYRLFSETERLKMSPVQFQLKLQLQSLTTKRKAFTLEKELARKSDDLRCLKEQLDETERLDGNEQLIKEARDLVSKRKSEINVARQCLSGDADADAQSCCWPNVTLPPPIDRDQLLHDGETAPDPEAIPDGYWMPQDMGHIIVTALVEGEEEGSPILPTGEVLLHSQAESDGTTAPPQEQYKWESSVSLQKLRSAIQLAKNATKEAEEKDANSELIQACKAVLHRKMEDALQLEDKDKIDKAEAFAAADADAIKLQKKTKTKKKGGGGGGKKKNAN